MWRCFPFKRKGNEYDKYERRYIKGLANLGALYLPKRGASPINFKHSGNCGDIIYAIPALLAITKEEKANLFLQVDKQGQYGKRLKHPLGQMMLNMQVASMLMPLLRYQSYINTCERFNDQSVDVDLDMIRELPLLLDRGNISRWYFQAFGVNYDLNKKWLSADTDSDMSGAIVIARSERYNSPNIDYSFIQKYPNVQFVGLEQEFYRMRKMVPHIKYRKVNDFLTMANIINSSKLFIGNQSFPFAIAEGLKVNRILEVYFKCPNVTVYGEKGFDFCFQPHFEKIVKERYEASY